MPNKHGDFIWYELLTSDADAAQRFYGDVVGWTYAGTLGFALVYLGEHYVVDLLAGLALTEGIRAAAPRFAPAVRAFGRAVAALEAKAHA